MVQTISSGALEFFKPDNDGYEPDIVVPAGNIRQAALSQRIQDRKDSADFVISNRYGRYGGEITSGDRLTLTITESGGGESYGDGIYGDGPYSGGAMQWVGIVRNVTYTQVDAQESVLELETSDFVTTVLDWRIVYDTFEDRQISGEDDAIIESILRNHAPEIDTGQVAEVGQTEDMFLSGTELREVVSGLAARSDAWMGSAGQSLIFEPLGDREPAFALEAHDYSLPASVRFVDDDLVNDLRVDGGSDYAQDDSSHGGDEDDPEVDGEVTVTEDDPAMFQVSTRKSMLDRVQVYTPESHDGGGDSLRVRIQKDEDGAPIAIGDSSSDIASKELSSEFLANDNWVTFIMPEHTLPEPNPWVIVEAGDDGQPIGVYSGQPAYTASYPYSVAVRIEARPSQREYRRRQGKLKNDALSTFNAARSEGQAKVDHNDRPHREIEFEAQSERAHALAPGDVITVDDFASSGASGEFIVLQRDDEIPEGESHKLYTDITAQEVATL